METRANYFLVGCFVLAMLAGIFGVGIWFARANLGEESTYYYTYFKGAVTGLAVGSTVRYRGVPVGTVSDIVIDDKNVELIEVTLALRPGTPVKTDTRAGLQPQGITGLSFIQLTGGTQTAEPLLPRPGKRRAVIPSVPSALDQIMNDAPLAIARIAELADRIARVMNEDNARNIDRIIDNTADAAGSLAHALLGVETLVLDAHQTMKGIDGTLANLDRATNEARGLISEATRTTREAGNLAPLASGMIDELKRTAGGFGRVADELEKLSIATRPGVQDFGQHGLYEMQQFLTEGRALMTTINRVIANFERDPARFLFGDQQKGVETR